jgi:hypothetical protein
LTVSDFMINVARLGLRRVALRSIASNQLWVYNQT